ncbi:MAG TPA: MAPEG family protein [Hyphomicrobium sp.]|nr:MAPEG family protein [Hyphomicrobium sp.]
MTVTDFLLPVFVQVGLTFVLLAMTSISRLSNLNRGIVKAGDIALGQPNWPERTTQLGNAFKNQLELPILFYVLIAFVLITRVGDVLLLVLAWLFVLLRIAHAYIHATNNRVMLRARVYGGGMAVLIAMWIVFAVKVLSGI